MWRREGLTSSAYLLSSTSRSTARNVPASACSWRADNDQESSPGAFVPHLDDRLSDERGRLREPGAQAARSRIHRGHARPGRRRHPQHLRRPPAIGGYADFLAGLAARYDYSEGEALPPTGRTGVSHYVRVIQGCDHNCTFCIVPRVRGRERHVPVPEVLEECRVAVRAGAREIVLLGQNVDDYRDPDGGGGLAALVREVER